MSHRLKKHLYRSYNQIKMKFTFAAALIATVTFAQENGLDDIQADLDKAMGDMDKAMSDFNKQMDKLSNATTEQLMATGTYLQTLSEAEKATLTAGQTKELKGESMTAEEKKLVDGYNAAWDGADGAISLAMAGVAATAAAFLF